MTCRAHLVRRSSRPYDAEAEAARLVSLVRPRRAATRETSGKRFQKSLENRSDACLSNRFSAIKRVVSRSLLAPRKHFRFPFLWPSLLENPASRQTNHDETTVFPRPQRETRERYAPATTTMTRPTDVDRHLPDCLRAVTRASRSITPRVTDPSPSSRGRRAKHRRAATRDRPTENHADR